MANPQHVAFGGFRGGRPAIARHVIEPIRRLVSEQLSDVVRYRVVDGDHTTASGLVALVLEDVLAPETVDRLVG